MITRRAIIASAVALPLTGRHAAHVHQAAARAAVGSGDGFTAMLRLAPDGLGAPASQVADFADIAGELSALGLLQPTGPDDPAFGDWSAALRRLALPDLLEHSADPTWRATFGFDAFDVDQSLLIGEPPVQLTLLRGRFDVKAISAALTQTGYRAIEDGSATVFSLSENGRINLSNPANKLALASYNNVAFLPDGTLAAASLLETITSTLAIAAGKTPSLSENPQVMTLISAVDAPFASALILTGDLISSLPRSTPIAEPGIAPVTLALTGVTLSGAGAAAAAAPQASSSPVAMAAGTFWTWALLAADRNVASTIADLIPQHIQSGRSLRTNEPYTDFFAS